MLIKFWISICIALLLSILLIFLFAKISKKMKKTPAAGGIIGFFTGFVIVIVTLLVPSRLYVVTGENEYSHFIVFGTPEFETSDGEKLDIDIPSGHCMVINDSDERIMIEEVVYGGYGFSPSPTEISEWTRNWDLIETGSIDYFFDDEPPSEISVSENSDEISKFWLRVARD